MVDYLVIIRNKNTNEQRVEVIESEPANIVDDLEVIIFNKLRYYEVEVVFDSVTKL